MRLLWRVAIALTGRYPPSRRRVTQLTRGWHHDEFRLIQRLWKGKPMTIRELVKNEIDMLPDDALFAVRDFVLSQKENLAADRPQARERNVHWLQESWKINDFKPVAREELYDRI